MKTLVQSAAAQFYFGTLVSSVGNMTFTISLLGFMLAREFSLLQASFIIGASRLIPILVASVWGDRADRLSPRSTVLVTEIGAAICSVGILTAWHQGHNAYWLLAGSAILRATLLAAQNGSKARISKELGEGNYTSQSRQAIWFNKATQGGTLFAGVIAWVAIKYFNFESIIIFDTATFIVNGIILYRLSIGQSKAIESIAEPIAKKFRDLYTFSKRAATLDLILAISSLGYSAFLARLAVNNQELIPLLMLTYGLGVWLAGYLEGWTRFKNSTSYSWITMGICFVLLGYFAGNGPIVLLISLIKETAFWTIYHRVSSHIQADTPREVFGSVSHARFAQYGATIAIGEWLVGAWANSVPVSIDGLWRSAICILVVLFFSVAKHESEKVYDRPVL